MDEASLSLWSILATLKIQLRNRSDPHYQSAKKAKQKQKTFMLKVKWKSAGYLLTTSH